MKSKPKARPKAKRASTTKRSTTAKRPAVRATVRAKPRPVPLPHDTPVDMPAVRVEPEPSAITLSLPSLEHAKKSAESAVSLAKQSQTIESAYQAWAELRAEHRLMLDRLEVQKRDLEEQGQFLVGAVKQARDLTEPSDQALVKTGEGLDGFARGAQEGLANARAQLIEREAALARQFNRGFSELRAEVRLRLERALQHVKPKLKLMVRTLSGGQRIVHLGRPSPDEAPMLLVLFTRKIPTRYDFLFDDSTDDPTQAPKDFYPDEQLRPDEVLGGITPLRERLAGTRDALPVKGIIPFFLPRAGGPASLLRLVERGPVMEVELADGEGWRNLLSADEAEALAGWLIKLKLEGRVELELSRG